jgi:hypothetical protein
MNWVIYFGPLSVVFIAMCIAGAIVAIHGHLRGSGGPLVQWWLLATAVWAAVITSYHMRSAPDARFFMPVAPFLFAGVSCLVARVPWSRVWMPLLLAAVFLQTGTVLVKTYTLRRIPEGISEMISFLEKIPERTNYLMYPEGHERFMPGSVDWYMGHELRDLWRGDNGIRIRMLNRYGLQRVVVKKARIRDVTPDTLDLGVYPARFVDDLRRDSRFTKLFENDVVIVFEVPALESAKEHPVQ